MVRPGVVVDEDWEIHLHDEHEDDAWEADDSRKKRYYVGRCAFEKRDPATGRYTCFRIFSGRIRLPEQPARFRARSPVRVESFSVTSPSDDESDPSEFVESVDSCPEPVRNPDPEDKEVVMTDEDVALNATLFLADICDEARRLKEEVAEEAKDWMERYLRKKRRRSVWLG